MNIAYFIMLVATICFLVIGIELEMPNITILGIPCALTGICIALIEKGIRSIIEN